MPKRRPLRSGVLLLALALSISQFDAAIATARTKAVDRAAEVHEIERRIDETYVVRAMRPKIVEKLEQARLAHRYDVADPDMFITLINEDLYAVSQDGHLYLANDRDQYVAMLAPPASTDGLEQYRRARAVRDHSGLTSLAILPGNIRYMKLEHFQWVSDITPAAYDDAARFLIDGDATIIDLRSNGGGNSEAADYFAKSFVAPDPLRPNDAASRGRNPAWRGKPLYLLIDAVVASAAEAVAYNAQQEKVATIVGTTSYGAANNNKRFPIAPQFVLSVSYNQPINPISGTNWEGVGVKPDIAVAGEKAMEAAQVAALDHLAGVPGVSAEQLADYRWARAAIAARLHPVTIDPAQSAARAGTFGTVEITASAEGLRFYRSDRPKRPQGVIMRPLDDTGLFAIDGYDDLRAKISANEIVLMHGAEAAREVFGRTKKSQASDPGGP